MHLASPWFGTFNRDVQFKWMIFSWHRKLNIRKRKNEEDQFIKKLNDHFTSYEDRLPKSLHNSSAEEEPCVGRSKAGLCIFSFERDTSAIIEFWMVCLRFVINRNSPQAGRQKQCPCMKSYLEESSLRRPGRLNCGRRRAEGGQHAECLVVSVMDGVNDGDDKEEENCESRSWRKPVFEVALFVYLSFGLHRFDSTKQVICFNRILDRFSIFAFRASARDYFPSSTGAAVQNTHCDLWK